MPAVRLAQRVEMFAASDGDVYLLRGGGHPDLALRRPGPAQRRALERLRAGAPRAELAAAFGDDGLDRLRSLGVVEDVVPRASDVLGAAELERFDRQLGYFADVADAPLDPVTCQERLREARVAILGLGGLGSWTAMALAAAGIGFLRGVDGDRVELSNLNRQVLYREADVGRAKAPAAAEAIGRVNSATTFEPVARRLDSADAVLQACEGVDLVVETADWPPHVFTRWVDAAALETGAAWIGASQWPPLLRVGPLLVPGLTACHACHEAALRESHPLYDELADWRAANPAPAATFGPASGIVGAALATEVVHWLGGVREPASLGRSILIDVRTLSTTPEPIERRADCPACAQRVVVAAGRSPSQ